MAINFSDQTTVVGIAVKVNSKGASLCFVLGQSKEERKETEVKLMKKLHNKHRGCHAETVISKLGTDTVNNTLIIKT